MLGFLVLKVSLITILYVFLQQIFWIFRNRNRLRAIPFEYTWGGVERSPIKKMGGGGQNEKIGGLHEEKIIGEGV